jgi:hypothetical protein
MLKSEIRERIAFLSTFLTVFVTGLFIGGLFVASYLNPLPYKIGRCMF